MNMLWLIDKHQSEAQKLLQLLNSIHLSYQMLKNKERKKKKQQRSDEYGLLLLALVHSMSSVWLESS